MIQAHLNTAAITKLMPADLMLSPASASGSGCRAGAGRGARLGGFTGQPGQDIGVTRMPAGAGMPGMGINGSLWGVSSRPARGITLSGPFCDADPSSGSCGTPGKPSAAMCADAVASSSQGSGLTAAGCASAAGAASLVGAGAGVAGSATPTADALSGAASSFTWLCALVWRCSIAARLSSPVTASPGRAVIDEGCACSCSCPLLRRPLLAALPPSPPDCTTHGFD